MVGTNGSECHSVSGPVGTTSVCPAKQTSGPRVPRRAQSLVTSPNLIGSHRNPARTRRAATSSWQPPSCGVIDLRAMSCFASSRAEDSPALLPSGIHVDLEVVERGALAAPGRRALTAPLLGLLSRLGRQSLAADLARSGLVDQPEHVGGRIGVGHRLILGDLAFDEQLEQRLLEGLRPWC